MSSELSMTLTTVDLDLIQFRPRYWLNELIWSGQAWEGAEQGVDCPLVEKEMQDNPEDKLPQEQTNEISHFLSNSYIIYYN